MRQSIIGALERETDLTVCGEAADVQEAIAAIAALHPDLVLTDIQLKSSSGLDLIKALHAQTPALPIVATTMFDVRPRGGRIRFRIQARRPGEVDCHHPRNAEVRRRN